MKVLRPPTYLEVIKEGMYFVNKLVSTLNIKSLFSPNYVHHAAALCKMYQKKLKGNTAKYFNWHTKWEFFLYFQAKIYPFLCLGVSGKTPTHQKN